MKKRIAIINQRYGEEVNGGSEYYTRKLAEHLKDIYEVEVITTTARDYDTWSPYYDEGIQELNGVNVRRFSVERPRNSRRFRIVNKLIRRTRVLKVHLEECWLKEQGPYVPALVEYIKNNEEYFDVFIFVTYLYYTTAMGLPEVASKSILVPTAHDEYCIYLEYYRKIFKYPKGIVYLTEEEKIFVENLFHNEEVPNVIAGSGIEIDLKTNESFQRMPLDYLIYVGRVDKGKNCDILFEYFSAYKKDYPSDLKLIVIGKLMIKPPENEDIICYGFVSEEEKYVAMAGAKALFMPSEYESLSIAVLEALALGVPVIVNERCEVLAKHCQKSRAGISYKAYNDFAKGIEFLRNNKEQYQEMKRAGKQYVNENYTWDKTVDMYKRLIDV